MSAEMWASAVVPLLVGLFNLLVAGYALAAGAKDRSLLAFALGPAGVGLWALAWFVFVFERETSSEMRVLGALGGALAMSGYAVDAVRAWPRRRIGLALLAVGLGALLLVVMVLNLVGDRYTFDPLGIGLRALALAAGALTFVAHLVEWRRDRRPGYSRWVFGSALIVGVACLAFALLAFTGQRDFVDVLLFVILWAEVLALGSIVHRRIEVRLLVTRATSYAILSLLVAASAALVFWALGYAVDPVVVAVTVALSLLASALFMGLSERLSFAVERLLFPEQARLQAALQSSRVELDDLRRRLQQAEKLAIAGELAASVAHEIKNPLSPIKGYAQMLQKRVPLVPEAERAFFDKALGIILSEADRIDARVHELLGLARGERRTLSRDETALLPRILKEAVLVGEAEPGIARIELNVDPQVQRVRGNEDELRGALVNLMKNAAEAMAGQGGAAVELRARPEGSHVVVELMDEGPGLLPAVAEQAFTAFFTTKQSGTGLGLAIARTAVEAAGGTLRLLPRPDRRGTVARLELLIAEERT
ncbi:MAG: hypothetical protein IPG45_14985 [Deltaproteobacteria bacterium]|jgi:signal transduction histidine kinase|nr:hypothetical protein [Deltaproteobacteria bacterium]